MLIADTIPIHLNYFDMNEKLLFANKAFLEWWGLEEKDLIGKTIQELAGESAYAELKDFLQKVRNGETVSYEFPFLNNAGKESYFLNSYIPDLDKDGKIRGIVATGIDLTLINKAEDKFRTLADSMPQIVWTANPDGNVDYYNKVWYEFTGLPRGSTGNELWSQIMHPDDTENLNTTWAHALKTGEAYETEYRIKQASSGEYRWHLSRALPSRDSEGNVIKWYGSNTDIHDGKIMLENLKLEKDLRDRFVSALSHDLRTPLTAAKMSAQLLLRKVPADPAIQKLIFRITDNMDRADRMIQDLLDANVINAGAKLPLNVRSCYLNQIVQDVIEEFSSIHGDRFSMHAEDDIVGTWDCDGLHRVLDNLLNNAIKYGSLGTPITARLKKSGRFAEVEIKNIGHPIPEDEQANLFDLFRRSGSTKSKDEKGWGIGLSLVKGIVGAHDGEVKVSSSEEEGTKFTIRLPLGEI